MSGRVISLTLPILKCKKCSLAAYTIEDLKLFKPHKQCKYGVIPVCNKCVNLENLKYKSTRKYLKEYRRNLSYINKIKAMSLFGNKCKHCEIEYNGTNEVIFDFHHLDSIIKEYSIGALLGDRLYKEVTEKEINKCILLCSNCHRMEHKRIRNES